MYGNSQSHTLCSEIHDHTQYVRKLTITHIMNGNSRLHTLCTEIHDHTHHVRKLTITNTMYGNSRSHTLCMEIHDHTHYVGKLTITHIMYGNSRSHTSCTVTHEYKSRVWFLWSIYMYGINVVCTCTRKTAKDEQPLTTRRNPNNFAFMYLLVFSTSRSHGYFWC